MVDDPGAGHLFALYLLAARWGSGLGHRLHGAGLDVLRSTGFRHAVLWVLESNARAVAFYEREGWRFDGQSQLERFGSESLTELRMSMRLDQP